MDIPRDTIDVCECCSGMGSINRDGVGKVMIVYIYRRWVDRKYMVGVAKIGGDANLQKLEVNVSSGARLSLSIIHIVPDV